MSDQHEGHHSGVERLREGKTLEDIFDVAIAFEATARDFYRDLAPKVSKRIRYLVEELAAEEQAHFDLFTALRNNPEIEEQVQQSVQCPAEDRRFSDYIQLPLLGDDPDDQSILQYALGREDSAMKQYGELAESTPAGPIKDLFNYLANEETLHKQELEKLYYQIVHSGGPNG
jgi:rubrerythrin